MYGGTDEAGTRDLRWANFGFQQVEDYHLLVVICVTTIVIKLVTFIVPP